MEELLTQWGLATLIPVFKENELDTENITLLTPDQIKELIPVLGIRIKFSSKLAELKNDVLIKDLDLANLPVIVASNELLEREIGSTSSDTTETTMVPICNTASAFIGLDNFLSQDDDKMPEFDLRTLLSMAPYGTLILKYYRENDSLNEYMRNKLVDIIIRNIYSYVMKHNLTHQQYNILASKIIQCFPNECLSKYYLSKRRQGHAVQAKGKLVDKAKNLRYHSPDKIRQRKRKKSPESHGQPKISKILTEDENNAILWLKFNREPWDEVLSYWKNTFHVRNTFESKTVSEFVTEWPIIADPRAESLIESDFSALYPEKELLLLRNWQDFFRKILFHKKKQVNENKDPALVELLHYLDTDENLSEDSGTAIQLLALPRLVPPKGRLKSGKGHWKFSVLESVEALIVHCLNPGDIELKIEQQIAKSSKRKVVLEVQPYLLVQGELTDIKNTYIVIDKIHFKCDSTLKGIDLLFKLFFVLKIKYPCQSEQIWMLIQRGIFKITDSDDKEIPYIADILNLFD